jgi:hypothetical protein
MMRIEVGNGEGIEGRATSIEELEQGRPGSECVSRKSLADKGRETIDDSISTFPVPVVA